MKLNKLPDVVIKNPFSDYIIIKKVDKIGLYTKSMLIILVIVSFAIVGFYLNVHHEQAMLLQQQIATKKSDDVQSGIVLATTADIISREGNLPIDVAKKYAIWIFEAGTKYNIDPILILSVMAVESSFNYKAVSSTGPIGLLQVSYYWHKEKTTKAALFDPKHNINIGAQIIKEYANRSSTIVETLLRFNGSLGKVPVYATKVLDKKLKFETEIIAAVKSI